MAYRICLLALLGLFTLATSAIARQWKSADGKFSVEAEFVGVAQGKVQLKKTSGKVIEVALDQLSPADREFVETAAKTPSPPAVKEEGKPLSAAEWLARPVTFHFDKTPLKDAIASLNAQCLLDTRALEEAGIAADTPITGKAQAGPALESLNAALKPLNIMADLQHHVLLVSTPERHSSLLVPRFYRLKQAGNLDALIQQITAQVEPNSWDDVGGPGSLSSLQGTVFVVAQTPMIHREIEKKFARQLLPVSAPADKVPLLAPTAGVNPLAKLREALCRPASVAVIETPLQDLVATLAKTNKVKIALDEKALEQAAIHPQTPLSIQLGDIPLESLLALTLHNLGLAWTIDGDQLLITTFQGASSRLITINYDVRDVTRGDFDTLIDGITSTVAPSSWQDVGGPGKIAVVNGNLAIMQTAQTHRILETWLADLRQAIKPGRGGK